MEERLEERLEKNNELEKRREERVTRKFKSKVKVRGLEERKVVLNFDPSLELCSFLFLFLTGRVLFYLGNSYNYLMES